MPNIVELVHSYLNVHREEIARLAELQGFLEQFPEWPDQCRRTNRVGHVTASAWIFHPQKPVVLTIDHLTLARRLPPGGHIDRSEESPLEAAVREVFEESGIALAELQRLHLPHPTTLLPNHDNRSNIDMPMELDMPADIDSHRIPASQRKAEPEHTHHDFRFAFVYLGADDFPRAAPEGSGTQETATVDWTAVEDFENAHSRRWVLPKLKQLSLRARRIA